MNVVGKAYVQMDAGLSRPVSDRQSRWVGSYLGRVRIGSSVSTLQAPRWHLVCAGQLSFTERALVFVGSTCSERITYESIMATSVDDAVDHVGRQIASMERLIVHRVAGQPIAFSVERGWHVLPYLQACLSAMSSDGTVNETPEMRAALDSGLLRGFQSDAASQTTPDEQLNLADTIAMITANGRYAGTALERGLLSLVPQLTVRARESILWDYRSDALRLLVG